MPILIMLSALLPQGAIKIDPRAKISLDEMVAAYRHLKTYSSEVETMSTVVRVRYHRPGRIAVSVNDGKVNPALMNPITSVVSDARFVYSFSPKHPMGYLKKPAQDETALLDAAFQPTIQGGFIRFLLRGEDPLMTFMSSGPKVRLAALSTGTESTSDGVATETIIASLIDDTYGQKSDVLFEIGKADHLVRKISMRPEGASPEGGIPLETYHSVEVDSVIPAANFIFVPAKGAVPVSTFQETLNSGLKVGVKPFPLTERDLKGRPISWDSLRGKVVLLDFWATWCMPCVAELPHLGELRKGFAHSGFEIVSVASDASETLDQVAGFVAKRGITWPQIYDKNGIMEKRFGIEVYPTTLLIGRDGRIVGINLAGPDLIKAVKLALSAPRSR
jgi:thiol-disulfide isomerase/thioredoxin